MSRRDQSLKEFRGKNPTRTGTWLRREALLGTGVWLHAYTRPAHRPREATSADK